MRRAGLSVLFCTALAGCSPSLPGLQSKAPRATYQSAKAPAAAVQCLAMALSWAGQPSIIPADDGQLVVAGDNAVGVTVRPAPTGSTWEVRELLAYGGRVRRSVESCR